jgi:hypothetical protein
MLWRISNDSAWFRASSATYRHYSGMTVEKAGRHWSAFDDAGTSTVGHFSTLDAIISLQKMSQSIWFFGQFGDQYGTTVYGDVRHRTRPVERGDTDEVFQFRCVQGGRFSEPLLSMIRRHFFEKATCVACSAPMDTIRFRELECFDAQYGVNIYLVCICGYPTWRMPRVPYSPQSRLLNRYRRLAADGKHSSNEIKEILATQAGRCIYCNVEFSDAVRPSKDHILPVIKGGSNWALNIVMACRTCNSRRGEIPFRTFCKLQSPTQNRRILACLRRRLVAIDEGDEGRGLRCLKKGLALHDRRNARYLDIQSLYSSARLNARRSHLLPGTIAAILKTRQPK